MQQRDAELNRRVWPFAVQVGVVVICAAIVEWPRLRVGLPHTLPFALGGDAAVQTVWIGAAVGAGVTVAALLRLLPAWRRLTGVFGGAAAAALAVVLVAGTRALVAHVQPGWLLSERAGLLPWLVACAAAVLGLLAGPVLRERSVFTLLWVSVVLGTPMTLAHRQARAETVLAEPLRSLQQIAPMRSGLFVSLPETTPVEWAWAFSRSLMDRGREVLAVPQDSAEERWLLRSGWIGLEYRVGEFAIMPALPRSQLLVEGPIRIRASWSGDGDSIVVTAAPAPGALAASIITPAGVVRFSVDERGHGTPRGDEQSRLRGLLRPMPPGTTLRVLVVSPASSDAYGWQDVRLP